MQHPIQQSRRWRHRGSLPSAVALIVVAVGLLPAAALATQARDILGPESVALGLGGDIFVSSYADRAVYRVRPGGVAEKWFHMDEVKLDSGERIGRRASPLGLVADVDAGKLYVAVREMAGGAIIEAKLSGQAEPRIWRRGLGTVNGLCLAKERNAMFVTDSGSPVLFGANGRLLRCSLTNSDPSEHQVLKRMAFPNGVAWLPEEDCILVTQTYCGGPWLPGRLARIDLASGRVNRVRLSGWPDGVFWDAERERAYVCLQRQGAVAAFRSDLVLDQRFDLRKSRPKAAPASAVAVGKKTLVYADFWDPRVSAITWNWITGNKSIFHHGIHKLNLETDHEK